MEYLVSYRFERTRRTRFCEALALHQIKQGVVMVLSAKTISGPNTATKYRSNSGLKERTVKKINTGMAP